MALGSRKLHFARGIHTKNFFSRFLPALSNYDKWKAYRLELAGTSKATRKEKIKENRESGRKTIHVFPPINYFGVAIKLMHVIDATGLRLSIYV